MSEDKNLKELQKELLYLLKLFHELCNKYDIKYSLHGGTLLGAIREKGFIPWDDDIDISLTRYNYEKLVKAIEEYGLSEELQFDSMSEKIHKIWLKKNNKRSTWIDIFIYDYISENRIIQKCKIYGLLILGAMIRDENSIKFANIKRKEFSNLHRCIYSIFYNIGKLFKHETKMKWMDYFERNAFTGSHQNIHRSNDKYIGMKLILEKDVMSQYMLTPFEDTELMISTRYNDILTSSYGTDYMTPRKPTKADDEVHKLIRENAN